METEIPLDIMKPIGLLDVNNGQTVGGGTLYALMGKSRCLLL